MPDLVPHNLPTGIFAGNVDEARIYDEEELLRELELFAHEKYALISSDALRLIMNQSTEGRTPIETLDHVIALAKARYPKEGDWIVINKERTLGVLG